LRAVEESGDTVTVELPYAGRYDWPAFEAWLRARAIGGVESVSANRYARSIVIAGEVGTIEVVPSAATIEFSPSAGMPEMRSSVVMLDEPPHAATYFGSSIRFANVKALPQIVERIRRMFDLDTDLATIEKHLSADPRLAALIARRPGLRLPGAWDGYELAVRAVLGQQISVGAASSLANRLVRAFGLALPPALRSPGIELTFPSPAVLAEADVASLGMPRARAEAVRTIARAAAEDPCLFFPADDLAGSIERLCKLRGIGEWTAHYIAMRALREADAFPASDIGLMRALAIDGGWRPTPRELSAIAEAWRPWRAYAALHLWAADAEQPRTGGQAG
jgi:AraC family transcriptional regulator of adaptative response / DNA-3-methyladenine glycosylase II